MCTVQTRTLLQPRIYFTNTRYLTSSYPFHNNMKFLTTVFFATLTLRRVGATDASQPGVEVSVHPSHDNIEINIQIELDSLLSNNKSTFINASNTLNSLRPDSSTLLAGPTTRAPCASGSHMHAHNASSLPITAATQGLFLNTTGTPTATGRLQTPSLIDLAAFSGGSSAGGQPALSVVVAVATCHLVAVAVL